MRVAAVQLPGVGGTLDERMAMATVQVAEAVASGASVVVLPEAFLPGYRHGVAEARGVARGWLSAEAQRLGVVTICGFLGRGEGGPACFVGVADPAGGWWEYQKRHPSPDEARSWRPGRRPVVATTTVGRIGILICADALHPSAWSAYVGNVDVVVIPAAWPDYRGRANTGGAGRRRAAAWLEREGRAHREAWLAKAAVVVGAPVVFANACGPWREAEGFDGASAIWDATGTLCVRLGDHGRDGGQDGGAAPGVVVAEAGPTAPPRGALRHGPRWGMFLAVYRAASAWSGAAAKWEPRLHAGQPGER